MPRKRRQDGILLGIEEERAPTGRTRIEKIKKLVSGFAQSVLVFPRQFSIGSQFLTADYFLLLNPLDYYCYPK